jgi:predicted Ser/Thr protein kinase
VNLGPEMLAAPKSDRYRIVSFLGRGATSLVYKALDVEKNMTVALKTIRFQEQDEIYRIKQEFRFFRDFYHQNLVLFYDLHVEDRSCFFTMEFVEGKDFVAHAAGDAAKLRDGFAQLVEAISAVHETGRLHRDLKPGNIVVEPSGRVVLLDFGLAYEAQGSIRGETQWLGGTPAYMAPEQTRGESATQASDLYGMGVILYETLTGRLPYRETAAVLRHEAQKTPPAHPATLRPEAPADLCDLAMRLLAFDPDERPPLAEVRRLLLADPTQEEAAAPAERKQAPFVGRVVEMAQLKYAWARALDGRRVAVHIKGVSGVGKTTLIERFLSEARQDEAAFVIYSRCHPQESVRYNALDALVDQLSRHLARERPERLKALTPDDLPALLTMFPVLARIPWPFEDEPQDLPNDPRALARLGMMALGQLVGRIAERRPIAIWIDDLQWSDSGSLPILDALAQAAGEGRPILTIFSYRSDLVTPGSVAAELEARGDSEDVEVERMTLAPLKTGEVLELMAELSGAAPDPVFARAVAEQSAGLPFFVLQFAAERSASAETPGERLARRIAALHPDQPLVLEVMSVAGRPLEEGVLVRILGRLSASARDMYRLLNQNLLRRAETHGRGAIETYHDMIRVAVLGAVDDDVKRERHRAIAEALAAEPELDHPVLAEHFLGAGETERASHHAILAGREARERLLFAQAVDFFALAARLRDPLADGAALAAEYAEALADAGRSSQAADMFAAAARVHAHDPARAAQLTDRAAGQMLYCGRLREGFDAYRGLFAGLGLDFPQTHQRAKRHSIVNRLALMSGAHRLSRLPLQREAALSRLDTLWAAAKGFVMLDYIVADAILSRYLREATKVSEPLRLARGLGMEASALAGYGRRWSLRRAETLLARAKTLVGATSDPYEQLVLATCRAGVAWQNGRWRETVEITREALARHRAQRVRYDFEITISTGLLLSSLSLLGELKAAKAVKQEVNADAEARGDGFVRSSYNLNYTVYVHLADDEPQTALGHADAILPALPEDRFTSLHWAHYVSGVNALVYAGRGWEAFDWVQRRWPIVVAAGFPQLGILAVQALEVRARAALAASRAGDPPEPYKAWSVERLLADARAQARAIARRDVLPCAAPTAAAIEASVARRRGEETKARRRMEQAAAGYEAAGMAHYAAAAAGSLSKLAEMGVVRPDKYADFLIFAL